MSAAWRSAALVTLWIGVPGCGPARGVSAAPAPVPAVPAMQVDVTLFFIGDAGAPAAPPDSEPVLRALRAAVGTAPRPVVVFLGDNVYPRGLPDSADGSRREAERRPRAPLAVLLASGAPGVVVPRDPGRG